MYINFKTVYQIVIQHTCSKHAVWKGWILFNALGEKKSYNSSCAANFGKQETPVCSAVFYMLVSRTLSYSAQVRPVLSRDIGHWLSYAQSICGAH